MLFIGGYFQKYCAKLLKGQMRRLAYPALKVLLKTYRKIRENLIRNGGRKGTGGLKLPLNLDWLNIFRISILVNFLLKVKDAFSLAAAPQF